MDIGTLHYVYYIYTLCESCACVTEIFRSLITLAYRFNVLQIARIYIAI